MDSNKPLKGPPTGLEANLPSSAQRPRQDPAPTSDGNATRQRRVSASKPAVRQSLYHTPSASSLNNQASNDQVTREDFERWLKQGEEESRNNLFSQVYEWLSREKSKRKQSSKKPNGSVNGSAIAGDNEGDENNNNDNGGGAPLTRTVSQGSDTALALDGLEKILLHYASRYDSRATSTCSSRRSTRRRPPPKGLRRGSASESDYELDPGTPGVDAVLDNSKTLSYTGGSAESEDGDGDGDAARVRRAKDREAWIIFKSELLRLTHTLELKGWRKLPMESAAEIDVVRLSGALTNAVYKVTPPQNISPPKAEDGSYTLVPRRPPP